MQLAVVEFARNICQMKDAHTTEIVEHCKYPVIDTLSEQKTLIREKKYGGTMRLGEYPCLIKKGSRAHLAYLKSRQGKQNKKGDILVQERHRHRYELNNEFRKNLEDKGLIMSGINPERDLVEIIEISQHPFFVAVQFHPEFKSKPLSPSPLFREFIRAAIHRST
jgi:CTP synthase